MGGIVGVIEKDKATESAAECLHDSQRRGHGGGRLISFENKKNHSGGMPYVVRDSFSGLVTEELLPRMDVILTKESGEKIRTDMSVGEIAGAKSYEHNASFAWTRLGSIGIVFTGYIKNMEDLKKWLFSKGSSMSDLVDNSAEIISHMMAKSEKNNVFDALAESLGRIDGRFAALAMTEDGIYGARGPYGKELLSLYSYADKTIFASESCAFPLGNFVDIEPGTIVYVGRDGKSKRKGFSDSKEQRCLHELIWRANPTSRVYGLSVSGFRNTLGIKLAQLYGSSFNGYSFVPVPDSAVSIGDGFSEASSLPISRALLRRHYIRFLGRKGGNTEKLMLDSEMITPYMVIIEDSINHGGTAKDNVDKLRSAGAGNIHMLSATPPRTRCPYRSPPSKKLLAERYKSSEKMAQELGLNGLSYLSCNDLRSCLNQPDKYCMECFSGLD